MIFLPHYTWAKNKNLKILIHSILLTFSTVRINQLSEKFISILNIFRGWGNLIRFVIVVETFFRVSSTRLSWGGLAKLNTGATSVLQLQVRVMKILKIDLKISRSWVV